MGALIDIVIPCFNQPEFTSVCLTHLSCNTDPSLIRVILVNNGSSIESRSRYAEVLDSCLFPSAIIDLPENLGFVKGTNVGIAVATAPYIMFLNNDTEVPPGWLEALMEVLEREEKVGIVGPLSSSLLQWQGQPEHRGKGWKILPNTAMLAFFCAVLRREIIAKCGYLSEEFQAGLGDDDDYCERVKRAGWRLALRRDLVVVHHHRATFREVYGENGWEGMQRKNIKLFREKWSV